VATLELKNVAKRYGETEVLRRINLTVGDGELLVLVGPSGCGKSSVLRVVAGLEDVSEGEVYLNHEPVTHASPKTRNVAMVFQNYALYPHMSVAENMEFGLKLAGVGTDARRTRVHDVAALLGLESLLTRKPKALSGGQRQRVALGRAIVRNPALFLFDEPLSNLDAELRVSMRAEIARLQRRLNTTTLYVTHDQVEAMTLGHRIAVMAPLRSSDDSSVQNIQQIGTPREIYDTPANVFVAKFLGSPAMNLIELGIKPQGGFVETPGLALRWPESTPFPASLRRLSTGLVGVRAEHLRRAEARDALHVAMQIDMIELVGSEMILYGHVDMGTTIVVKIAADHTVQLGQRLDLSAPLEQLHFFDPHHLGRLT